MKSIQHQIEINWPVKALFNYVSDLSNNAAWQRQVVNAEWLEGNKNTSGAKFVETRKILGKELSATLEVREFEQYKKRSLAMLSGHLRTHLTMEFEPQGENTVMTLTIACDTSGIYRNSENLILRQAMREGYENLSRLKFLLESSN
jgi:hypothetical protein